MRPEDLNKVIPEKINLKNLMEVLGVLTVLIALMAFGSEHAGDHARVETMLTKVDENVQMLIDHHISSPTTTLQVPVKEDSN